MKKQPYKHTKTDRRATLAMTKELGFTLIEILVVISIMAILATVSTQIMLSLIKSNNKTNVVNEVKQNGSFVLDLMQRDIKSSINAASASPTTLTLTNQDGTTTIYDCSVAASPANGYIKRNNQDLLTSSATGTVSVSSCSFSVDLNTNPLLVTIDFSLAQSSASPLRSDLTATQNFHVSVSLRTY